MVYRFSLLTSHTKRSGFLQPATPHSLPIALLRTCRQVHVESSYILYCENTFVRVTTDLPITAKDIAATGVACVGAGKRIRKCVQSHPCRRDFDLAVVLLSRKFDPSGPRSKDLKTDMTRYQPREKNRRHFLIAEEDMSTFCVALCLIDTGTEKRLGCWFVGLHVPIACYRPDPVVPSPERQMQLIDPFRHLWGIEHIRAGGLICYQWTNAVAFARKIRCPVRRSCKGGLDRLISLTHEASQRIEVPDIFDPIETLVSCQRALEAHETCSAVVGDRVIRVPLYHAIYPGYRVSEVLDIELSRIQDLFIRAYMALRLWRQAREEANLERVQWSKGSETISEPIHRGHMHIQSFRASMEERDLLSARESIRAAVHSFESIKMADLDDPEAQEVSEYLEQTRVLDRLVHESEDCEDFFPGITAMMPGM